MAQHSALYVGARGKAATTFSALRNTAICFALLTVWGVSAVPGMEVPAFGKICLMLITPPVAYFLALHVFFSGLPKLMTLAGTSPTTIQVDVRPVNRLKPSAKRASARRCILPYILGRADGGYVFHIDPQPYITRLFFQDDRHFLVMPAGPGGLRTPEPALITGDGNWFGIRVRDLRKSSAGQSTE